MASSPVKTEVRERLFYPVNNTTWFIPLSTLLTLNLTGLFLTRLSFALINTSFRSWIGALISVLTLTGLLNTVLLILGIVAAAKKKISHSLLVAIEFFALTVTILIFVILVTVIVLLSVFSSEVRLIIAESVVNVIILAILVVLSIVFVVYLFRIKPRNEFGQVVELVEFVEEAVERAVEKSEREPEIVEKMVSIASEPLEKLSKRHEKKHHRKESEVKVKCEIEGEKVPKKIIEKKLETSKTSKEEEDISSLMF
jgi:hypothetical protein